MSGAIAGASTLKIAGTIGFFGDVIWASAALMLTVEFLRRGRNIRSLGWSALLISILLFIFIDGMTGYVLPQLAASGNSAAFEGFKRIWDMLFLLGTATYGAGLIAAFSEDIADRFPTTNRAIAVALVAIGLIAIVTSAGGFAGGISMVPLDKVAGGTIRLGSAILIFASRQIARLPGAK